jgi:hypothetical protein
MAGLTAIKRTGYLHGGVTHPDGRRGFFKGAQADTSKNEPMSPGTSVGGGTRGGTGKGRQDAESQYGADSYGSYNSTTNKSERSSNTNITKPNIITPKQKPPKTKDNYKTNFIEDYFSYSIPTTIMNNIAKSKFVTNLNAKRREKYINDLLETDPDEYNRIMGDLSKINMIVGPQGITTQVPPSMGFTQTDYGMPKAPPSMLTSNFEVIDGRKSLGDPAALEILGQKYKDTLTFDDNEGGDGDGLQPYLPINYNTGAALPIEEEEEKIYDYHLGLGGQKIGADVTRASYIFNQGGRVPRNMGGIMNAVPRQGYFLGKIVKGVGKAIGSVADAAGKVLKSDAGKMALLAGGAYLAGGYLPGGKGIMGGFSNFSNLAKNALLKDRALGFTKGNYSLGKILGLSAALPFIPGINQAQVDQMPGDDGMRGGRLIDPLTGEEGTPASMRANIENAKIEAAGDPVKLAALNQKYNNMLFSILPYENYGTYAQGGRIRAQEGGLMNLGGMEKDYRNEGGFVPIGKQEKADDVPARLSVNEFVFTADAVRNAGGGDIDKGAEVMENMMKNLENGGRVSEESQGNAGAQQMFSVSERIGEVI